MKSFIIPAMIIMLLSFNSCNLLRNCEKGNSTIAEKELSLQGIKSVSISGSGDLYIIDDNNEMVKVRTDNNLMDKIIFEVKGDKLSIKTDGNLCPTKLDFYLSAKALEEIDVSGSCTVVSQVPFNGNKFEVEVSGSGSVELPEVNVNRFDIEISGSGSVDAIGNADNVEAEISGSGSLYMESFVTKNINAEISGSGSIEIQVEETINAELSGSGSILYWGNPKISSEVSGSGAIRKAYEQEK